MTISSSQFKKDVTGRNKINERVIYIKRSRLFLQSSNTV